MKNEFVIYEIALRLKELGFDEECLCAYDKNEMLYHSHKTDKLFTILNSNLSNQCSAPLYQQVFRWFRENYDLHYTIDYVSAADIFKYELWIKGRIYKYNTYEEAELACLNKLIEIAKL